MEPRIEICSPKKLTGIRMTMSFARNTTGMLWGSFMPRRKEIRNVSGPELYSMQFYHPQFFEKPDPDVPFEKWAAVAVTGFDDIPDGMETFTLAGGLYAVFDYKGDASDAEAIFRHIFQDWLPTSGYLLDDRPHFEILGEKYKKGDPDSEEEIWIPVKKRTWPDFH